MVPFFIIYGYFVLTDIPMLATTAFTNMREVLGVQPTADNVYNADTFENPRPETVQSNWSELAFGSHYPIE